MESKFAPDEAIVMKGLPYFSTLNVKMRALYRKQGDGDFIESADREIRVLTGVTGRLHLLSHEADGW